MNVPFDLRTAPWVPCVDPNETPVELGLRDALVRAHEMRELFGESPPVTAAMYRLLLAILHRVFGPADEEEWRALWAVGQWDAARVDAYLAEWGYRFDLFDHGRPFFQAPDERVRRKSVASLIHDVASGNNATLFDHHTDDRGPVLRPAQAARMVVTAQSFGLCGLSGLRQQFTDGTCARGVVFLVQGSNLFETLCLNMIAYPTQESVMSHTAQDRPAWEMDDPFAPARDQPLGYLDYLTWQNRRVLFFPEEDDGQVVVREMTMGPALRMDSAVLDPMIHYRKHRTRGWAPLSFDEEHALWRDSAALLALHSDDERVPRTFRWLADLVLDGALDRAQTRRYLALGMCKKQSKVSFCRSERMPLPLAYMRERALVESLGTALAMAEQTSRSLWGATHTLAQFVVVPELDQPGARKLRREDVDPLVQGWAVERRFWSRLELPFRDTVVRLPEDRAGALESWRDTLRNTAWDAFEQVAEEVSHDTRRMKAVVRARGQLGLGLAKALFPR
jgi:CRISPR system Cascade subunit CasA